MALLLLSGAIAGGALFAKYKLEGLRGRILETAEARMGTDITVSSISAFGLRGLRADGLDFSRRLDDGSEIGLKIPVVYVYVDLTELLYGEVVVDRIQLEGAQLFVKRATSGTVPPRIPTLDPLRAPLPNVAFRVMGSDCSIRVENAVGTSPIELSGIDFDVAKLPESNALSGTIEALYGGDSSKQIKATARYTSLDDFEARADCTNITAEDVNGFLPASRRFVLDGAIEPSIRIEGKADDTLAISLTSSVTNLTLRDQPDFLEPLTGTIDARAIYDPNGQVLTVGLSQAVTNDMSGMVSGTVRFAEKSPTFDLKLISSQLPLGKVLSFALQDRVEQYGDLTYTLSPDAEVTLHLGGSAESPAYRVSASMSGADAAFKPKDKRFPEGTLKLGRVEATWESETKEPRVNLAIVDGAIRKSDYGVEATNITAGVSIVGRRIEVAALNAIAKEQPLVANGWYDLAKKTGELSAAGTVAEIGKTKLANAIKSTELDGSVTVKATGRFENGTLTFEGDVEASQTQIAYEWFFLKPPGIGATGHISGAFVPKKSVKIDVDGIVAGSELKASTLLAHTGKKWQLRTTNAKSNKLDLVSVGKCLPLPYLVSLGTGTNASYDWTRVDGRDSNDFTAKLAVEIDELAIRAEGGKQPFVCQDVSLTGEIVHGAKRETTLTLHAKRATTPPLGGDVWFVPIVRDLKKYPSDNRTFYYNLSADSLDVPPWSGANFKGHAYQTDTESGLNAYSAKIGDGTMEGSYNSYRIENTYKTYAKWTNVPASFFMAHLKQPQIFFGNMSGEVTYTQDRDDPRSLAGSGHFEMADGQFSADYLIALFERQFEGDVASLPPSLKFSKLQSTIEFDRDVIRTPKIHLESDAMKLDADGEFVTDGDMDYTIKVAVSPEAAERIPLLNENFNVQGHRLAQEDIDLAFRLSGPTLKPVSTVSETPPVRVTLVSGALETAREALQVIDAPRKILFDLLKIGGGIVGAKKQPQSGNKN